MIRNPQVGDRVTTPGSDERRPGTIVEVGTWRGRRGATTGVRIVVALDETDIRYHYRPADLKRLDEGGRHAHG